MEDLDFVLRSKNKIKSLQSDNETLKNNLVEAHREIDLLKHKLKEVNDLLASSKREIEEKNNLIQKIKDIVYEDKYEEWTRSNWRLMERTDFEDFLERLKSVFG
jgi:chromosome segregation ATPase